MAVGVVDVVGVVVALVVAVVSVGVVVTLVVVNGHESQSTGHSDCVARLTSGSLQRLTS